MSDRGTAFASTARASSPAQSLRLERTSSAKRLDAAIFRKAWIRGQEVARDPRLVEKLERQISRAGPTAGELVHSASSSAGTASR